MPSFTAIQGPATQSRVTDSSVQPPRYLGDNPISTTAIRPGAAKGCAGLARHFAALSGRARRCQRLALPAQLPVQAPLADTRPTETMKLGPGGASFVVICSPAP
jgi:hypothetical protein